MSSQIPDSNSYTSVRFKWHISNFSSLGVSHESDVLSVGRLEWRVKIFPRGATTPHDALSLHLVPVDNTRLPYASVRFIVTGQNDHSHNVCEGINSKLHVHGGGWPSFMHLSRLYDRSRNYLVRDTCIIEVVVTSLTREARA
ncbi:hypothetical protein MKX01_017875 [Papaver californicum]|nr:hypothetical protein MKX01_017875 [Papaver californicum]